MRSACFVILTLLAGCSDKPDAAMDKNIAASLEAFDNRRIYSTLDVQTLRQIPDADLEQAVVDYVITKLNDNYEREVEIVRALSPGVRALYVTWGVEAEVNNGGFNQYYFNSSGAFAPDAVGAFEYFGATQHAALMREANSVRAAEAKDMAKFKDAGTIEAFSESYEHTKLNPLDDRFFALKEDLSALRIARIREMPEQFTGR
jgi:hypothetical protein